MARCRNCGTNFRIKEARSEFNDALEDEFDYDDEIGGILCLECAIFDYDPEYTSNKNLGRAIQMVSGDEDYDDDFVQRHL